MQSHTRRTFLTTTARTAAVVTTGTATGIVLTLPPTPVAAALEPDPVFLAVRRWLDARRQTDEARDRLFDALEATFGNPTPSPGDKSGHMGEWLDAMHSPEFGPMREAWDAARDRARALGDEVERTPATTLHGVAEKLRASLQRDMTKSAVADLERLLT